ncbi:hypothetical protein LXL04_022874 [Taraxacum kok-saghyz]
MMLDESSTVLHYSNQDVNIGDVLKDYMLRNPHSDAISSPKDGELSANGEMVSNQAQDSDEMKIDETDKSNPMDATAEGAANKLNSINQGIATVTTGESTAEGSEIVMHSDQDAKRQGNPASAFVRSFSQMVETKKKSVNCKIKVIPKNPSKKHGEVELPVPLLVSGSAPYQKTLVGCFIEKKLAFPTVKYFVYRMWK